MSTTAAHKKKFFVVNFHCIRESENEFLRMRHAIDSQMFDKVSEHFDLTYLKLKNNTCVIKQPHSNEVFFNGKNRFFFVPVRLYRYLRQQKPDIVFIHGFVFPFQLLWMYYFIPRNTRVIVQHHAEKVFQHPIKRWLQRISYSKAQLYLFAGKALADDYLLHHIIKDARMIHEVMETSSSFTLLPKPQDDLLADAKGGPVLLWVGRLNANKDPFTVLKALQKLKQDGWLFRLYMFYGSAELEQGIETYINDHKLQHDIILMGKAAYQELEKWYNAADYFISASHYEGSGVALCEALACGCIPIVSNIPSFRMMTGHGAVGNLFEAGNASDLYEKLLLAFTKNSRDEKQPIRAHFDRHLSFTAIADKIYELTTLEK